MRIRLHEIELGSTEVQKTTAFVQTALGLQPTLQQQELTVFDAGCKELISTFPATYQRAL